MSAPTITRPDLRAVILDALDDAFWFRKGEIAGCVYCPKNPTGICADHQDDNALALQYEEARKQIERSPECPEVLAVLAGTEEGE